MRNLVASTTHISRIPNQRRLQITVTLAVLSKETSSPLEPAPQLLSDGDVITYGAHSSPIRHYIRSVCYRGNLHLASIKVSVAHAHLTDTEIKQEYCNRPGTVIVDGVGGIATDRRTAERGLYVSGIPQVSDPLDVGLLAHGVTKKSIAWQADLGSADPLRGSADPLRGKFVSRPGYTAIVTYAVPTDHPTRGVCSPTLRGIIAGEATATECGLDLLDWAFDGDTTRKSNFSNRVRACVETNLWGV